jgi:hypothetical protein
LNSDTRASIGVGGSKLYDLSVDKPVLVGAIHVDCSLRFESNPNAGDEANIYTISDLHTHRKGLLIDALDVMDQECVEELFGRLNSGPQETLKIE